MTSKARVEYDVLSDGVRLTVRRGREVVTWEVVSTISVDENPAIIDERAWLKLPEDDARAMYEALADYFGHAGHDIRSLRKDYDSERERVDKLTDAVVGIARRTTGAS